MEKIHQRNWSETNDYRNQKIFELINNSELKNMALQNFKQLSNEDLLKLHDYQMLSTYNCPEIFLVAFDLKPNLKEWIIEIKERLLKGDYSAFDFTYRSRSNIVLALNLSKLMDQQTQDLLTKFSKENPNAFQLSA